MAIFERQFQFSGADGLPIAAFHWADDAVTPHAVLQVAHGMGEHARRYREPLEPHSTERREVRHRRARIDAPRTLEVLDLQGDAAMPRWVERDGRVKLSAAWLIERAGFRRGEAAGAVGLSTRHTLAIVCHDGARAHDVVSFARHVRRTVAARFDVTLNPEPVLWGALSLEA